MGAVFAGAARAPITAVLIMFELTGEYSIILPLMLAIVAGDRREPAVSKDTVYTLKLRRRGVDLTQPPHRGALAGRTVATLMVPAPPCVAPDTPLRSVLGRLISRGRSVVPVVADDRYLGVLTVHGVAEVLAQDEESASSVVGDAIETVPTARPEMAASSAVERLRSADGDGLPVVDEAGRLCGWLDGGSLLALLDPALSPGATALRSAHAPAA